MYFSAQKWAFYFGKSADILFRISVWSVEFCVVANRSQAFFGVCDFGCTHFLLWGIIKMKKILSLVLILAFMLTISACKENDNNNNSSVITDTTASDTTAADKAAADKAAADKAAADKAAADKAAADKAAADKAAADKAAADKAAADKAAADKAAADKAAADKAAADKAAADKAAADKAAADKAAADKAAADKAAADKEAEKAQRILSRQKLNISELQTELNNKFGTVNIGIDTWSLSYTVNKNDSDFWPQDIWIQTSWKPQSVDVYDLKYSIDYTEQQKNSAVSALKELQKKIYNYVYSKYPALKITGCYYSYYYKYPAIREGFTSTSFLTWTNYGGDWMFSGVYDTKFVTEFSWQTDKDEYKF